MVWLGGLGRESDRRTHARVEALNTMRSDPSDGHPIALSGNRLNDAHLGPHAFGGSLSDLSSMKKLGADFCRQWGHGMVWCGGCGVVCGSLP